MTNFTLVSNSKLQKPLTSWSQITLVSVWGSLADLYACVSEVLDSFFNEWINHDGTQGTSFTDSSNLSSF